MLRRLMDRFRRDTADGPPPAETPRDYVQEREATRHAELSEADREWEAASRERARARDAGEQPSTERE
jgi:hypothetical protein